MSVNNTLIFQPTKGIFKNTIKPYQRWYEASDMSPGLEIDGEYYHLLRTTGYFWRFEPKKIVVCKENGEIEKSEEITRKWLKVYIYTLL